MGGSDQWGNIVAGVELIRKADGGHAFALVCPLLTTASGEKMGKSEGNSLWLDPELTSPYDFYQYWINVDDSDVERLLRLYTFLPESRIEELTRAEGVGLREAKQTLAREVTTLAHGEAAATSAEAATRALFGGAPDIDDPNIPTTEIPAGEADALSLADLFVRAGLVPSRGEARRKAAEGALWMDGSGSRTLTRRSTGRRRHAAPLRQETLPPHSRRALTASNLERSVAQAGDGARMTSISGSTSSNPASRSRSPATMSTRSASGPAGPAGASAPCRGS